MILSAFLCAARSFGPIALRGPLSACIIILSLLCCSGFHDFPLILPVLLTSCSFDLAVCQVFFFFGGRATSRARARNVIILLQIGDLARVALCQTPNPQLLFRLLMFALLTCSRGCGRDLLTPRQIATFCVTSQSVRALFFFVGFTFLKIPRRVCLTRPL